MCNLLKTLKSVKEIHFKAIRFFLYRTQHTNAIFLILSRRSAVICSYNFPCLKADKSSYCKPMRVVFLFLGTLKLSPFLLKLKKKKKKADYIMSESIPNYKEKTEANPLNPFPLVQRVRPFKIELRIT